jgi:hypothetical protein
MRHIHHIRPKHQGGSNDPSNLISLTIVQHAMWHFADWQLTKTTENFIAWRSLAGKITKEQAIFEAQSLGGKKAVKQLQEWWEQQDPQKIIETASKAGKIGGVSDLYDGTSRLIHLQRIAGSGGKAAAGRGAKKTNAQMWRSTHPDFEQYETNAGALTRWQKARGIDTTLRERLY